MGLETELEFRKCRGEGFSPNTVLPYPRHCSGLEKRNVNGKGKSKPARKDNRLSLKEDFRREISFGRYRSSSCNNSPSPRLENCGFEGNVELKRGSIYQSSREVSHMKKRASRTEAPRGSDGGLNFRAVDSLCSSDEPCPSDDFFEICFDSNVGGEAIGIQNDGIALVEKTTTTARFPENDRKTRFSPIRKMLRKSLLDDFSRLPDSHLEPDENPRVATRESRRSLVMDSPVHLHGRLKLENKDGMLRFEFSSKCPEEVLIAKTWKADNASNWVYTFHSVENSRKRSNAGLSDGNKELPMAGQMQVSCYLDERGLEHFMVTEFVLHDVARAKKIPDSSKPDKGSTKDLAKVNPQPKQVLDGKESDPSSGSCPLAPLELRPNLEIAATVIQVPIEKRESLKCKSGEKMQSNLLKMDPKGRVAECSGSGSAKVKVVIPSGSHGMPSDETRGPSPLLDRWRLGGGCDCGGWDMACPLVVFGNPDLGSGEDSLLVESQRPLELFVQGSKENAPALTLSFIKEGEYAVDFHAQLSALQAFSISVAILHSTEASRNTAQLPRCSSLKMLIEEEVKFLIESVTKDEKTKVTKTLKETFALNPPFSPISRV